MQSKLVSFILGIVFATALMKLPYVVVFYILAITLWLAAILCLFFITTFYLFLTLVAVKEAQGYCYTGPRIISAYPSPDTRCFFYYA